MKTEMKFGGATPVHGDRALRMAKAIAAPHPMVYIMVSWPDSHEEVVWAEDPFDRRRHYAMSPKTWVRLRDELMYQDRRLIDDVAKVTQVRGYSVKILMTDRFDTAVHGADAPDLNEPPKLQCIVLAPDGPRW